MKWNNLRRTANSQIKKNPEIVFNQLFVTKKTQELSEIGPCSGINQKQLRCVFANLSWNGNFNTASI